VRLEWQTSEHNDRWLHGFLRQWIFHDDLYESARRPFYCALMLLALLLPVAVPKDRWPKFSYEKQWQKLMDFIERRRRAAAQAKAAVPTVKPPVAAPVPAGCSGKRRVPLRNHPPPVDDEAAKPPEARPAGCGGEETTSPFRVGATTRGRRMISMSKPISASQAQEYHKEEFANARDNYYTEGDHVRGEWQGKLAERYGLAGEVGEEQFARLSEGQHPATGEQLVRHQTAREYVNEQGQTVRTMEHRAGWDATFSAPKSVSLTALVGGDDRIREAHRESVRVALTEMEKYAQARIGGNTPAETTGAWVVAKFEHDSSRPVDGYAAPQLHTHTVIFNIAETADGTTRALQPQELYKTQQYATAVYRSELSARLQTLGYEIERGEHGQPEIKGYTREYLEASSPRRQQITEQLAEQGRSGPEAAQIAAHKTREAKLDLTPEQVQAQHRAMAAEYGHQPQRVIEEAQRRPGVELQPEESQRVAQAAVSYARERGTEREAIVDERTLMRDALKHSMGAARLPEVRAEFERRVAAHELIEVERRPGLAGRAFTTGEMQGYEREIIERMRMGQGNREVLADGQVRQQVEGTIRI
jgi:conjugative relaxase-like TrwC/TraI family protein